MTSRDVRHTPFEIVARGEQVTLCVARCRAIDSVLTEAVLESLADSVAVGHGHDSARVSSRDVAKIIGLAESSVRRRLARIGL